jgi:hypothetical protein
MDLKSGTETAALSPMREDKPRLMNLAKRMMARPTMSPETRKTLQKLIFFWSVSRMIVPIW